MTNAHVTDNSSYLGCSNTMSWARCMYTSVFDATFTSVVLASDRRLSLYKSGARALRAQLVHEEGLSVSEVATMAHFVALFHSNIATMGQLFHNCCVLVKDVRELERDGDDGVYVAHLIGFICARLKRSVPECMAKISQILFRAYMETTLEVQRVRRINADSDRAIFTCLMMLFHEYMGTVGSLVPLERATFDAWLSKAAAHAPTMSASGALERVWGIRDAKHVRFYAECARNMGWMTLRKRKRAAVRRGTCGVCHERKLIVGIPCAHEFCNACLTAWNNPTCPVCRAPL